jgi:hypothetical protein
MTRGDQPRVAGELGSPGPQAATVRELLTVDLRGLKTLLMAHCVASGHPASAVVRDALQRHLQPNAQRPMQLHALAPGQGTFTAADDSSPFPDSEGQTRTRVSLRLTLADADELQRRAQTAGLSLAAWVLHVMRSGQDPVSAEHRAARIAALTQSNAEIATLARNIGHLSALLRQGEVRAAQEYRQILDTVAADVRQHLKLAAQVLADERKQTQTQPTAPPGDTHD